jgi:hypothetical protein
MNRSLATATVASLLMAALPAAVVSAHPAPPSPTVHCTVSGGTTLTLKTKDGDVELSLPAGARLDGHGTVRGETEVADDVSANLAPPPGKPLGPAMHGMLVADVDLSGHGCQGLILPAGSDVDLNGVWMGGVFVIHQASFHAAAPVVAKGGAQLVLGVQVAVVLETASGAETVTLPAGTVINVAGNRTGALVASGAIPELYLLKLPAGFTLNLVGVPAGKLASPATLTLKFLGGTGTAATLPPSGSGTLTVTAIPPAPFPVQAGGPAATVPVSTTVSTTTPSTVAGNTGTSGTTPSATVANTTNSSTNTTATAPSSAVAAASGSVLPKTGGNPADVPLGLALISFGGALALWPRLKKKKA